MVGRAVGQRIGVGHAQFDDVRTGLGDCGHDLNCLFQARVAGSHVDDQHPTSGPAAVSKGLLNRVHYYVALLAFIERLQQAFHFCCIFVAPA